MQPISDAALTKQLSTMPPTPSRHPIWPFEPSSEGPQFACLSDTHMQVPASAWKVG